MCEFHFQIYFTSAVQVKSASARVQLIETSLQISNFFEKNQVCEDTIDQCSTFKNASPRNFEMVFCHQNYQKFCVKNCSSEREKLLKFETDGREFAKFLRSLEQFFQSVFGLSNG